MIGLWYDMSKNLVLEPKLVFTSSVKGRPEDLQKKPDLNYNGEKKKKQYKTKNKDFQSRRIYKMWEGLVKVTWDKLNDFRIND